MPSRSSVTMARCTRTCSSGSRSPAPSRTQRSFSSVVSDVPFQKAWRSITPEARFTLIPTTSASRPASVRTRRPPPPIRIGGPPRRERLRLAVERGDPVVVARRGARLGGPEPPEHLQRLGQPLDAQAWPVERDPGRLVVSRHPPGADAEVEAPSGEQVEGRGLLGEHDGMPVVVGEDHGADPKGGRRVGRGHQRGERRQRVVEVVGDREARPAEVLHPARQVRQPSPSAGPRHWIPKRKGRTADQSAAYGSPAWVT